MASTNSGPKANNNGVEEASNHLLAGILGSLPSWDMSGAQGGNPSWESTNNSPPCNDFYNNFFSTLDGTASDLGGIVMARAHLNHGTTTPTSSNSSISCSMCEVNATNRCIQCNEFMCNDCSRDHHNSLQFANHSIFLLPSPIGTSPTGGFSAGTMSNPKPNQFCDLHNEILQYVCQPCKMLVCQCCTLYEHKGHKYSSVQNFYDESNDIINHALESSNTGKTCIKGSIDRSLAFIRLVERNCAELSENIRKVSRQFIMAIEDVERYLLESVEKLRQRRLAILNDQMAGLKSALAGLSETMDMLQKISENWSGMDNIDIAKKILNGQRQLEQFAAIYKDLHPKYEEFVFVPPDDKMLQDILKKGVIVRVNDNKSNVVNGTAGIGGSVSEPGAVGPTPSASVPVAGLSIPINTNGPFNCENSFNNIPSSMLPLRSCNASAIERELGVLCKSSNLRLSAPRSTQAIGSFTGPVKARISNTLSLSFATEGHDDGQVSRPWGLCVDKLGHILISDRRNNRVQVFNPDGTLKFKFGRKGSGNGEFDLPAGICVDIDNRIIVVDKDNHRVQIFTSTGIYLSKFGSFGKEYGQFQYPWDVAVNSRRQIVVTDSRNHRIQQFDSEGRFIRQIVFDSNYQTKGPASPRGVCYTPTGNIIVSDFDNHCLYLINPDTHEILSSKGHEGDGIQEFNRPSGICCDDDGRIIIADSKNQRIVVYNSSLKYLWNIEIRPSRNPSMPHNLDEKDRTCDVSLMPDGRIVFLIELSPDTKEGSNPYKRFVHVF
ncbi:protein wech [Anastrepha ludens]|uniref:protein wech n=1 Tax=Anastrepha ludens TaxID=28586 RepID=UPI0023AF64FD|nr:protein wech [Anastrepha ludens]XP_053962796.1 protein wech [Anastrepha ludens]XP_053962798.1 protein wech [Anastrepha ludens]